MIPRESANAVSVLGEGAVGQKAVPTIMNKIGGPWTMFLVSKGGCGLGGWHERFS